MPVHLVELLTEIQAVETAAFLAMGGETKKSFSDLVSEAIEAYVGAWLADNGSIPTDKTQRVEYVKKLAARNLEKLREQLLTKQ
ncbi:MAG: hypothetical protein JNJ54_34905 [Myxococcaceae bacterium]|nr:hypothetical protein [Myxococcaceae bacterium]